MRFVRLLLSISVLVVLSGPLVAVSVNNPSAFPDSGRILINKITPLYFFTPLDPLRSKYMGDSAEESQRRRGHVKDVHVLRYLREMIDYCRLDRHPEMQREYEEVWLTAASKIYGPLPDRWRMAMLKRQTKLNLPPLTPDPPRLVEWQREALKWPQRKIVSNYKKQTGGKFEILECGHHAFATRLRRRAPDETRGCGDCYAADQKMQQELAELPKKKPTRETAPRQKKEVSA